MKTTKINLHAKTWQFSHKLKSHIAVVMTMALFILFALLTGCDDADLDFSDVRKFAPGTHSGILLLRLSKEGKNHLIAYVNRLLVEYDLNEWDGCLVIATDHKGRIKKPIRS